MEPLRLAFTVACPPERAFTLWASQTSRWWPHGHSVSGAPGLKVVFEPGGRIYERTPDGAEHDWGEVRVWEPPHRLVYLWHLRFDRADATEVEELVIEDRRGEPGPVAPLHVHHEDDEAWLTLSGALVVRVGDDPVHLRPGEAVRVPAGTPHAYDITEPARYLLAMTPRIRELVAELHTPGETDWRAYASELL